MKTVGHSGSSIKCSLNVSCCRGKMPGKATLKEEGFILAHSLGGTVYNNRKLVAGASRALSAVKKQRGQCCAFCLLSIQSGTPAHGLAPPHSGWGFIHQLPESRPSLTDTPTGHPSLHSPPQSRQEIYLPGASRSQPTDDSC